MSVTYGFYNSVNSDRRYNAKQMSSMFNGLINEGVFKSIGNCLIVTEGSGMSINVGIGKAWFDGTWTDNDSILPLTVEQSEVVLNRFDMVVLETNSTDSVRANSIKIIKGTPATEPEPASLISEELIHQYPLAYIYVAAGVTEITQSVITNKVGTDACPFVNGLLETISTEELIKQWGSQFNDWFYNLKEVLTQNAETNIISMINTHSENHLKHSDYVIATGSPNTYNVSLEPSVTSYVKGMSVCVEINVTSNGPSTININGLGTKPILDSLGNPISGSGLKAGLPYTLRYNGTSFIVQGKGGGGTATADKILAPYTATNDNELVTGTIQTVSGDVSVLVDRPNAGPWLLPVKAPVAYCAPGTKLWAADSNYEAQNIVSTVDIFGLKGTANINSLGGKRFATGTIPVDANGYFAIPLGWKPSRFIISTQNVAPIAPPSEDYDNGTIFYPQRQYMKNQSDISELTPFNTQGGYLFLQGNDVCISDGYTLNGIPFYVSFYDTQTLGRIPVIGSYQYIGGGGQTKPFLFFNQAVYYAWE